MTETRWTPVKQFVVLGIVVTAIAGAVVLCGVHEALRRVERRWA